MTVYSLATLPTRTQFVVRQKLFESDDELILSIVFLSIHDTKSGSSDKILGCLCFGSFFKTYARLHNILQYGSRVSRLAVGRDASQAEHFLRYLPKVTLSSKYFAL